VARIEVVFDNISVKQVTMVTFNGLNVNFGIQPDPSVMKKDIINLDVFSSLTALYGYTNLERN